MSLGGYITRRPKYEQTGVSIGDVPGVQTITHNLNTELVSVVCYLAGTKHRIYLSDNVLNANQVELNATGSTKTIDIVIFG